MKKLIVRDIEKAVDDESVSLSARVDIQGWEIPDRPARPDKLFFRFHRDFEHMIARRGDAFVAAFVLQCMAAGSDLHIKGAVSPTLLANIHTMQDIWCSWKPQMFQRVAVSADQVEVSDPGSDKTGSFFSLGVDSFYTLTRNRKPGAADSPPIDYLIFMRGFEHRLGEDKTDGKQMKDMVAQVANRTDCVPLFGSTNYREFFWLSWGIGHGPAVGATALALSRGLGRAVIPSTDSYAHLRTGIGSHPLIDPLWSTEALAVFHDGAERTRQTKTQYIIEHMPEALRFFHVCWKNQDQALNCGRCIKCINTTVTLDMLGKLGQAATFGDRVDRDFPRMMLFQPSLNFNSLHEHLRMARELGHRRYARIFQQVIRARRADEYRKEFCPMWDRLTRPWRIGLRRIRY